MRQHIDGILLYDEYVKFYSRAFTTESVFLIQSGIFPDGDQDVFQRHFPALQGCLPTYSVIQRTKYLGFIRECA